MLFPTSPLPDLLLELVGIWPFEKLTSPSIGEQEVVKSLCAMAGMHFRKLPNSYSLQVEKCQLKSQTIKCPTIGANILFKLGQNPILIP